MCTRHMLCGMETTKVAGYAIDVEYDAETLHIHAKNKMARGALTGWTSTAVETGDGKYKIETSSGGADVVILRSQIADVKFKNANPLVNGNLAVTTTEGNRYQMHFRRNQRAGFEVLAHELGAR